MSVATYRDALGAVRAFAAFASIPKRHAATAEPVATWQRGGERLRFERERALRAADTIARKGDATPRDP